jgi:DNA replication protein
MTPKNFASLDLNYLLLNNYKKLKITEDELVVILMISHLLNEGNELVTNSLLALKMNFDEVTIDDIVVSLLMKGFLEYQDGSNGGIRTSLEPLNKILYRELELSILGNGLKEDKILSEQITKLYKKFEKDFSRSLAPVEIQKIDEWISVDKYSIDEIEFALKEAKINNALSIKYIDKILFNNKKRQDIAAEGYSFRSEERQVTEDVDDVIEILKTKWTK